MPIVLRCHKGIGPAVTGTALVAKDNFSARYDLDRKAGVFSRPAHKLAGQSYVGRILVLDQAKGGVATAWMLRDMTERILKSIISVVESVRPRPKLPEPRPRQPRPELRQEPADL